MMTITTQNLIDAARAIGLHVSEVISGALVIIDGSDTIWEPQHDKSQLMDLQWGLNLDVFFNKDGSGYLDHHTLPAMILFGNTFESFAEAIILAAAEIGRAKQ